ncbi:MAG: DUF3788 domain-containing protein [Euryarchaeota archaeon]|nr:DUF3788 domain-containing protein [Euryarchaeota archaeon]MBU4607927.1 DUF3788 domain-containing protein [Euryarchaeota archaeon]MBV1729903.1 DUF3788 domain-containing protein [Methanobacterium sp.]MBV1755424.1 DUF3788 domain-containing protein [Methanobacterium sp.]MBV1768472.1 DUF3788 domain-containing protein [Methanobacterium sp.]
MFDDIFKNKNMVPETSTILNYCGPWAGNLLECIKEYGDGLEWKFYSKKMGWTLKCLLESQTLCFVQPHEGDIEFVINLNKKDESWINESSQFRAQVKKEIENLRQYQEGKSYRFMVGSSEDRELAHQLIKIKSITLLKRNNQY